MRVATGIAIPALLLSGCGEERRHKPESAPPPIPVTTAVVREIEWASIYETTGTLRAKTSAALASKIMGSIREMRVSAGDRVQAGQLIAAIESRDLEANLRQAQAGEEEAQSGIAEVDNGIAAAKAQLELATVTFQRMKDLYEKKSVSNQEYDEATSKVNVARAEHDMAVARRRQLDARIRRAEQIVRSAEVTMGYSEVRAPFDGVITEKRAEQGDMAAPGSPLVVIERAGAYQLEVPVEESRLGAIRVGHPLTVTLDALGRDIEANVTEVVPVVDAASRTYLVRILLPSGPGLQSGMFGRARFRVGSRRTVAMPKSAVTAAGQVSMVSVVENGVARSRLVSLGEHTAEMVEVLSGVSAGELIVTPRPASLPDGSRVEARR